MTYSLATDTYSSRSEVVAGGEEGEMTGAWKMPAASACPPRGRNESRPAGLWEGNGGRERHG